MNWIYDYDFSHAELTTEQLSELVQAADVASIADFKNFDKNKSIDERFNELCELHKITPKDIDIDEPTPHEQAAKVTPVSETNFQKSIDFSLKWEGGRNFTIVNGKPKIYDDKTLYYKIEAIKNIRSKFLPEFKDYLS